MVGCQALECPERAAVVAELGVVVVLDDERSGVLGPGHERLAARAVEGAAPRVRVRRGDQDCVGAGICQRGWVKPALVDRDRHGFESCRLDRGAMPGVAWLLHRDALCARASEHAAEEGQSLREASADDDSVRRCNGSPYTAEVVGQHSA